MKKIGTPFERDVEFTGSVDMVLCTDSKLLDNLRKRGFDLPKLKSGHIRFPQEAARVEVDEIQVVVPLTKEQISKAEAVLGEAPKEIKISVVPNERLRRLSPVPSSNKRRSNANLASR